MSKPPFIYVTLLCQKNRSKQQIFSGGEAGGVEVEREVLRIQQQQRAAGDLEVERLGVLPW